jgi:N-acetylglutamate synthase-like GNAT family acetyltransferase
MKIKKATKKDYKEIFELLRHLWPKERLVEKKLQGIFNQQLKEGKIFLLAEDKGIALGFISLSIRLDIQNNGKIGQIDELVVNKIYRDKGVGRKLISRVSKEAKKKGCIELHLYSNKKRKKSHRFYRDLGFKNTAHLFWRKVR